MLGTLLVAALDEWHQSLIPSRTGRWEDVALDTCAGLAAQLLLFFWAGFNNRSTAATTASPADK